MRDSESSGTGSVFAIAGHPIHPMIVPIPLAALLGTFGSDVTFLATGAPFWARASHILLVIALVTGAIAAAGGLVELLGLRRARTMAMAWLHGAGNAVALLLSLVNLLLRGGEEAVTITVAVISGVVVAILAATSWLGGELSYRHGVGVSPSLGKEGRGGFGRPDAGR